MTPRSAASTVYRPLNAQMATSTSTMVPMPKPRPGPPPPTVRLPPLAAAEQPGQAALQIAQHLVQIGRALFGLVAAPPGVAFAAGITAGFVPRHVG